jgi:hypothetical protein
VTIEFQGKLYAILASGVDSDGHKGLLYCCEQGSGEIVTIAIPFDSDPYIVPGHPGFKTAETEVARTCRNCLHLRGMKGDYMCGCVGGCRFGEELGDIYSDPQSCDSWTTCPGY